MTTTSSDSSLSSYLTTDSSDSATDSSDFSLLSGPCLSSEIRDTKTYKKFNCKIPSLSSSTLEKFAITSKDLKKAKNWSSESSLSSIASWTTCWTCKYILSSSNNLSQDIVIDKENETKKQLSKEKPSKTTRSVGINSSNEDELEKENLVRQIKCKSVGVQTTDSLLESRKTKQAIKKLDKKIGTEPSLEVIKKNAVSWTVPTTTVDQPKINEIKTRRYGLQTIDDSNNSKLTLQQAFKTKCRQVMKESESRVRKINARAAIRKATADCRIERQLQEYILCNKLKQDLNSKLANQAKIQIIRPRKVFTEKEMRQQTKRIYSTLPEIKKRKEEKKREENQQSHRLMAQIFSQRLKSSAVKGKVSFPITQKITCY